MLSISASEGSRTKWLSSNKFPKNVTKEVYKNPLFWLFKIMEIFLR